MPKNNFSYILKALRLLEEFEQLIFSVNTPSPRLSSAQNEENGGEYDTPRNGLGNEKIEQSKSCDASLAQDTKASNSPFLSSDVDCIVTKAFNFGVFLVELDETGIPILEMQSNHTYLWL